MMLRRGRLGARRRRSHDEISPMESMVNLVDVMLVFICGLLISIITYWNLDVANLVNIADRGQLVLIDNPEELEQQMGALSNYQDLGSALLDPRSGEVYVLEE